MFLIRKKSKSVSAKTTAKGVLKFNLKELPKGKCKMTILTNNKNYNINQKFTLKIKYDLNKYYEDIQFKQLWIMFIIV